MNGDDWFVIKLSLFDEEFQCLINISSEFRLKYADVLKAFTAVKFVNNKRNPLNFMLLLEFRNKPLPHPLITIFSFRGKHVCNCV